MRTPIYFRRGNKADLPALLAGEPGVAVDTKQVFVGADGTLVGNIGLVSAVSGGHKTQNGSGNLAVTANAQGTVVITFPKAFTSTPAVYVSFSASGAGYGTNTTIGSFATTATGSNVAITSGTAQTLSFNWLAIGT